MMKRYFADKRRFIFECRPVLTENLQELAQVFGLAEFPGFSDDEDERN